MILSKKIIVGGSFILAAGIIILMIYLISDYFRLPDITDETQMITITIPKRSTVDAICDTLLRNNLIDDKELFTFWLTTLEKDRSLKAGKFDVPRGYNYPQLIRYLTHAQAKEIKVTLLEGWRMNEIAQRLAADLGIDADEFLRACHDSVLLSEHQLTAASAEGYLLPDTYHFYWGMSERDIAGHLIRQTRAIFTDTVRSKIDSLSMSEYEIITLASIIEGEAVFDEERTTISSVYHNRLRRGIKLQADPTIQYILKEPPRRLLYRDLRIDSPYNTYMYKGLPPGPINNPGKNSILAAVFPAKTNFLYFVARGDGRHTFTKTASEHSREKEKFNQIRREVYRNKNRVSREK